MCSKGSSASAGAGAAASLPAFRERDFLLGHMQRSMDFFDPSRTIDPSGGFFHFYAADGSVYDKHIRVLVTEARFVFSYAVAYQHLKKKVYLDAVRHGVIGLRGRLRNSASDATRLCFVLRQSNLDRHPYCHPCHIGRPTAGTTGSSRTTGPLTLRFTPTLWPWCSSHIPRPSLLAWTRAPF